MVRLYSSTAKPVCEVAHIVFVRIRKSMSRLKISAISYLNTAPLMWDFEHGEAGANFDIAYTIPSACAEALRNQTADIGIIPAAAYTTIPDLAIIPDVAIASRRAVRSILLVSEKPVEEIRTVALDTSSMTSVALTKILLAKWFGGARDYRPMAPDLDSMLAECDGALLIGDPALQIDRTRYTSLDLAEEWNRLTGKSFVFAFWAIRKQALVTQDASSIARLFQNSRDHGVLAQNVESIVHEWTTRLNLPPGIIRSYLTHNIHYYLDPPCIEGLRLFYKYGGEIGALPSAPELEFIEAGTSRRLMATDGK
jgi:chorismate dehydratase